MYVFICMCVCVLKIEALHMFLSPVSSTSTARITSADFMRIDVHLTTRILPSWQDTSLLVVGFFEMENKGLPGKMKL